MIRAAVPALLFVFTLVLIALAERMAPGFASASNILQLLKLASFLGLVALGQTIVMLVGGIDLSIAWVLTGSAVVFTRICAGQDANMLPAAAAAIAVGLVTGLINGFGVVKLRIAPIVMTLAMNNIMLGATLVYTGGTPSGGNSPFARDSGNRRYRRRALDGAGLGGSRPSSPSSPSATRAGAAVLLAVGEKPARQPAQRHRQ